MNPQIIISWLVKLLQEDKGLNSLSKNPIEVTAEFNVLPKNCGRATLISVRLGQIVTRNDSNFCPRRTAYVRFVIMSPRTQQRVNQRTLNDLGAHTQLYAVFTELDRIVQTLPTTQLPDGWEIARGYLDTGPINVFSTTEGNIGLEMAATVPFDFLQYGG